MGALNRLVAFQAVNEASVTPETAKRILGLSPAAAPVAAAASSGGPGGAGGAAGAGGPDEFGAFLADVTVTVGKAVEAWRARVTEAMLRWGGGSEEHTSELQSPCNLVCRLLLEKKKKKNKNNTRERTKY